MVQDPYPVHAHQISMMMNLGQKKLKMGLVNFLIVMSCCKSYSGLAVGEVVTRQVAERQRVVMLTV